MLGGRVLRRTDGCDPQAEPRTSRSPEEERARARTLLGVEIEITPAGKAMKRLSLLSGGEKSMTALAFLFSVFLARGKLPVLHPRRGRGRPERPQQHPDRFLDLLGAVLGAGSVHRRHTRSG